MPGIAATLTCCSTAAAPPRTPRSSKPVFANVVGARHSGVNFADVPDNAFTTDGVQSALPGATLWYPHGFTAGSGGSVAFASAATANPALAGWSEVLYRDSNCNGVLDGSEGAGAIGAAIAVNAGETVCVLLKEFVPAGAPGGAQNLVTVTANFTYSNASPALASNQAHTDTTTVGAAGSAGLSLQKSVDKATALPGEVLTYTVVYTNTSNAPLSSIVINDSTPAFTNFLSAACGPNPPNVGACSVSSAKPPGCASSSHVRGTRTDNRTCHAGGNPHRWTWHQRPWRRRACAGVAVGAPPCRRARRRSRKAYWLGPTWPRRAARHRSRHAVRRRRSGDGNRCPHDGEHGGGAPVETR